MQIYRAVTPCSFSVLANPGIALKRGGLSYKSVPQTVRRLSRSLRTPQAAPGFSDMAAEVLAKQHRFILVSDLDWTMVMPTTSPNTRRL